MFYVLEFIVNWKTYETCLPSQIIKVPISTLGSEVTHEHTALGSGVIKLRIKIFLLRKF